MKKDISRKILVIGVLFLFLGASATLCVSANRAWSDNFDSYTNDQFLDGGAEDGGWEGWGNPPDPTCGAYVRDDQFRSGPYSVEIDVTSDLVHQYTGYTAGVWIYTAWQFIPTTFAGDTYFIMLSSYDGSGSTPGCTWCIQLSFNSATGLIESQWNGETLAYATNAWKEIKCVIDLDADWLEIYYDGTLLAEHAWTDSVNNDGSATRDIAAVDLFSDTGSIVYYDDISLRPAAELICDAGGPYAGEVDEVIQFTGTASGGTEPYTWAWSFGDSGTAATQNPTHAYTAAGNYTVTLTVTDATSAIVSDTALATITEIQEEPEIVIDTISGGFGVKAVIKNIGTGDATGVSWTIALDGQMIFLGKEKTGTVDIAAGEQVTIKDPLVLGFGATNINVTAGTATKTATGKVILFFVLGVA
jgi:hypothetical protein